MNEQQRKDVVNAFARLLDSTVAFRERFDLDTHGYTCEADLRMLSEEVYELIAEVTKYDNPEYENTAKPYDALYEAADVIVCVIGIITRMEAVDDFPAAMVSVARKNDAKTHETHHINGAGKVARRE